MRTSHYLVLVLSILLTSGCSKPTSPELSANGSATADKATINRVCEIAAELMGSDSTKVTPDTSLDDDHAISDAAIEGLKGSGDLKTEFGKLTMSKLATLLGSSGAVAQTADVIAKISVMADGTVYLNSESVTIKSFPTKLDGLLDASEVWYFRENPGAEEPHENAMKVMAELARRKLPIAMYLDRDFTQRYMGQ